MKIHNNRHIGVLVVVIAIALTAIIPAFAGKKTVKPAKTLISDTLSYNDRRRFDYFYLEALKQQSCEHYDAAFDLFKHCLEINPNAAEVYYALYSYYSNLKQDTVALSCLEKAAALNPDNGAYQEKVAQSYVELKDYEKAIATYERFYSTNTDRSDVLEVLIKLYNKKQDYDNAIRTINRVEQIEGIDENTILSKMVIYQKKGDIKSSYAEMKSLVDCYPNDANYKVMFGNWLMMNDKKKEAYKIFNNVLKDEPDNMSAKGSLYDYYKAEGNDLIAEKLLDDILLSKKTPTSLKLTMLKDIVMNNEQASGDSTLVLNLFDKVIAANPKEVDIAILKVAYMNVKKMPESEIEKVLRNILDVNPDAALVRIQLIQQLWKKKNWDDVIALSKAGTLYNPDEMAFYYFLGLSLFLNDKSDLALDALRKGVSVIDSDSDPTMVSDLYAIMGDIFHRKGNNQEAYAAYDSCLQWKDDNIVCLNNYAYYLSEVGTDLQKAEQMSYKTIKAEPKNSTYLDTYAWVLFMQTRYAEAKIYIDQAISTDTNTVKSVGVIEHAGDIYYMNGDVDKAVSYWEESRLKGNKNAVTERKIKLRKYIKE